MTLDKFRAKYLRQMSPKGATTALMPAPLGKRQRERAHHREKFAEWLRSEKTKDSMASVPSKLDAKEVLLDLDRDAKSKYKDMDVDGYYTSVPDFVGASDEADSAVSKDKIEIPADKYKMGAVYKKGNAFYDDKGDFVYRLPVETMGNKTY